MARTITLEELKTGVRELVDKPATGWLTDAVLTRFIDSAYTELYRMLVKSNPEEFYKETTITGDGTNNSFDLPSDFQGIVAVEYVWSADQYVPLQRIIGSERSLFDYGVGGVARGYTLIHHSANPDTPRIRLLPRPLSGDTYRLTYLKAPQVLSSDDDEIDGIAGFERYIIAKVCVSVCLRERADPRDFEREVTRQEQNIKRAADLRHVEETVKVRSPWEVVPMDRLSRKDP